MSRSYDDITPAERKIITRSLNNHATDLVAESKRLIALGQDGMGNKLIKDAGVITRELVPIFDDQASLDLDEARGDKKKKEKKEEPRNRGLMITSGSKDAAKDGKVAATGE